MRKTKHYLILTIFIFAILSCQQKQEKPKVNSTKLTEKSKEALAFCQRKKMNTNFCILIDMSMHSGLYRLFVWDFNKKKIIKKSLVAHGSGNKFFRNRNKVKFSNVEDSHFSSIGKYKIGERGYSSWGIHIKYSLHGLEPTNNNAYKRFIVLHSWEKIKDSETYPNYIVRSWGCPAVSNNMMRYLDTKLKTTKRPTLLWIFD